MEEPIDQIDRLLQELRDEERCVDASYKLAQIGGARALEGLLAALEDVKPVVRTFTVLALAEVADPKTTESVVRLLNDPEISVRSGAAFALGKIGDPRCIPALKTALEASLEVDAHLCRQLIIALADLSEADAVEPILRACQSSFSEIRLVAVDHLGEIGDEQTRARLIDLLQQEREAEVRAALAKAIEQLGAR